MQSTIPMLSAFHSHVQIHHNPQTQRGFSIIWEKKDFDKNIVMPSYDSHSLFCTAHFPDNL